MDLWPVRGTALAQGAAAACVALVALSACARQSSPAAPAATAPPAVRYESHLAAGGVVPPGAMLRNPHAGDAATARSGAQLFTAMNCDGCHGAQGIGWVGPNLADGRWRYGATDGEIFSSIYYGRPRGMPAFGGVLGTEGVWTLVTYLRSLPVPAGLATESWE
jgi:mono/diheme cytochrome c family protein